VPGLPDIPSIPVVPRIPGVPDPLRRIDVPSDLEAVTTKGAEDDPKAGGMTRESLDRIWRAATDWYRSGVHPAIQICIRREGVVVMDRAIGHARGNGPRDDEHEPKEPATPETPFLTYSMSKAVTAFMVHLLHERGALDIQDRVCQYIDGYEKHDKGDITIAHVLAHRAGVPNLPREAFDLANAHDWEKIVHWLVEAEPGHGPGARLAYHAVSGGYILAEVVRQATGKDIRTILAEEILDPLHFRWMNYGVEKKDLDAVAVDYITGPRALPPLSTFMTRALGLPFDELVEAANDPRFRTALVPSANTVTTANEFSRFYELMRRGGELDGVRVMEPHTIRQALTEQSHLEVDMSLGFPTRFGYGLMLGAQLLSLYGRDTQHAFGHLGFTNMLAWADPERATAVCVMTNGKPLLYPDVPRFYNLMQRITSETPKVDGSEILI
jgi:CubicO group peptidase (beta-lactamase class C family)